MNDRGLRFEEICTKSSGCVFRQPEFQREPCRSRHYPLLALREVVSETFGYQIFKETPNAQRPTPNVQLQRGGIQPEWPKFSSLDVRQWFAHYSRIARCPLKLKRRSSLRSRMSCSSTSSVTPSC